MSKVNIPVNAVHSDRAREFKTVQMRAWLADRQIAQTRTSGSEAAGNSTAEPRTRSLLRTASACPEDWPLAAAHAADGLWRKAFPHVGTSKSTRLDLDKRSGSRQRAIGASKSGRWMRDETRIFLLDGNVEATEEWLQMCQMVTSS